MKRFFASFWGGNKKETNDYTDFLIKELENLKNESEKTHKENESKIEKLQKEISKDKDEIERLQKQLKEYKDKNADLLKNGEDIESLNRRLDEYEDSYETLFSLMKNAKKEAEQIILKARQEAEQNIVNANMEAEEIKRKAKVKAEAFQKEAEAQLNKKIEEQGKEYMLAKYKLMEYLNALNKTQSKLIDTYNEFGELVQKLPLRIEDAFSEKPFELLSKKQTDDAEKKHY